MNLHEESLREERNLFVKELFILLLTKSINLSLINLPKGVKAIINYDRVREFVKNLSASKACTVQEFLESAKKIPREDFVTLALFALEDSSDAPLKDVVQYMEDDGNYVSSISVKRVTQHYVASVLGERIYYHFVGLLGEES